MRIALASDHAAVALKGELVLWLTAAGHDAIDLGPDGAGSVDYPDFGYLLANHVATGNVDCGIAMCGSGIGISIAVNRHPAVRCALAFPIHASSITETNKAR